MGRRGQYSKIQCTYTKIINLRNISPQKRMGVFFAESTEFFAESSEFFAESSEVRGANMQESSR